MDKRADGAMTQLVADAERLNNEHRWKPLGVVIIGAGLFAIAQALRELTVRK
jgi:hypothetical protein